MRQFNTLREELHMREEKRILIHEYYKYRDCSACRRWQDKSD